MLSFKIFKNKWINKKKIYIYIFYFFYFFTLPSSCSVSLCNFSRFLCVIREGGLRTREGIWSRCRRQWRHRLMTSSLRAAQLCVCVCVCVIAMVTRRGKITRLRMIPAEIWSVQMSFLKRVNMNICIDYRACAGFTLSSGFVQKLSLMIQFLQLIQTELIHVQNQVKFISIVLNITDRFKAASQQGCLL